MRSLFLLTVTCLTALCGAATAGTHEFVKMASLDAVTEPAAPTEPVGAPPKPTREGRTLAGDYLSSLFAQRHHDWKKAGEYLDGIMKETPDDPSLVKRAMVLAMGSGDAATALTLAKKAITEEKDPSPLATLFLAAGALHDKDYKAAQTYIDSLEAGSLSDFIMPLLQSWSQAGVGVMNIKNLDKSTIHIHHAVLIADFLKKPVDIDPMVKVAASSQSFTIEDIERLGNLYAHLGNTKLAISMFEKIVDQWPEHPSAAEKIEILKKGEKLETLVSVDSPEQGVAAAFYDMANLLYREYADDSARVFAQMALYLAPQMTDAHLLLAAIDARNERYAEAIKSYQMIGPDNQYFKEARRRAADLMEDSGDIEGALKELQMLADEYKDMDSLIKVGDLYRRQENFPKAVEVYNKAAARFDGNIPKEYWNLLYVRGMSYEQNGEWDKAEADLKAAMAYQPDHPFVLNYLGYAWADKGEHLDEALELVKKAAASQPNDGYIVDSLGWVHYRMGQYKEALGQIEKAIEILPYDAVVNDHLGDTYWQLGRKREARFQWKRAANYSKDEAFIAKINEKMENGLPAAPPVQEAHSQAVPETASPGEPEAAPVATP